MQVQQLPIYSLVDLWVYSPNCLTGWELNSSGSLWPGDHGIVTSETDFSKNYWLPDKNVMSYLYFKAEGLWFSNVPQNANSVIRVGTKIVSVKVNQIRS